MNHKEIDIELKALRKKRRFLLLIGPAPYTLLVTLVIVFKIKTLLFVVQLLVIPVFILMTILALITWKIYWLHVKKTTTVDDWEKKQ